MRKYRIKKKLPKRFFFSTVFQLWPRGTGRRNGRVVISEGYRMMTHHKKYVNRERTGTRTNLNQKNNDDCCTLACLIDLFVTLTFALHDYY